jgi:Protein of unknown function (DUF3892)
LLRTTGTWDRRRYVMASLQVTCIRKRGDHYNPHERIEGIGGSGWYQTEDSAIADIENRVNSYHVSAGGRTVAVIVAVHSGRKYLKTEADGYSPDNLLALPECP